MKDQRKCHICSVQAQSGPSEARQKPPKVTFCQLALPWATLGGALRVSASFEAETSLPLTPTFQIFITLNINLQNIAFA
jgi:hypothetical protein